MIGVNNDIKHEPVLVHKGEDEIEILVVEMNSGIKNMPIRVITGYAPQDNPTKSEDVKKVNEFYSQLEQQIVDSESSGCGTIIELDSNAKLGNENINGDPHMISENGKILRDITERRNLVVVNSLSKCDGIITRRRETSNSLEESVIDYFIVCKKVEPFVTKMVVDDKREKVLTKFATKNGDKVVKESDHNILICEFSFSVPRKEKQRTEVFTMRNKENLKDFKENTENAMEFSECFMDNSDIKTQGERWLKILRHKIRQSFKKVRIDKTRKNNKTLIDIKIDQRGIIKKEIINAKNMQKKQELEDKLEKIEDEISASCAEEYAQKISDHVSNVSDIGGGMNTNKMWSLKRKVLNKPPEPVTAKEDLEGNFVTNAEKLKKLYLDHYKDRLSHKEISPNLKRLKELREELFELRLKSCRENKSPDFKIEDLDKALMKLKGGKAIDPTGLVAELFQPGNIGKELKKSILMMINKIKSENGNEPEFMEYANILSFYKGKGKTSDLNNDRGIFILNILRMIKDRMVYNDIKEDLEESMSDAQVGARENKSIRNHLFVIYSILNSVNQKESPAIDVTVYDVKKCFDNLWLEECCNNIFEAGVQDDKLVLIYEGNINNNVAIKTPAGLTNRVNIKNIVSQGSTMGPSLCATQSDLIGKDALDREEHLYMYKGEVGVPPLIMIDDVANISECGVDTVIDNAYINAKMEQTKLQLNCDKCHKIHVGKTDLNCPILTVHDQIMDEVLEEKYLGDLVTKDGKHLKNIKLRKSRGMGAMVDIVSLLQSLCLGKFYFTIAVLLRQTMLISVILLNSETWLRLTQPEIKELESVDEIFMRKILEAPCSSPNSSLYLELGLVKIKYIIKARRILYLFYLLHCDDNDLVKKVLKAQQRNPVKGDWCLVVQEDMNDLGLENITWDEIENMSKYKFKKQVKEAMIDTAFQDLIDAKNKLSKMKNLKYDKLELQEYLKSQEISLRQKKMLYKFRTRMINVGDNFGNKQSKCFWCKAAPDEQSHMYLLCEKLKQECSQIAENRESVTYMDIFSDETDKIGKVGKLLEQAVRLKELRESQSD